ncbi:sugar ABC transporter substrate-binding protein [Amycolatopsis rhabdoformis]|uniref:Sugar ABC transporter substrate-binding protein n=1 Tax=Amycolatopsis rhabdoformis TaxID=1448059 RepID=A0ABZ1IH68_9PSEU|nr:sugar ABC transporter substrate-binding protein [Amycolatopsis rhabdoformis]WSE33607.1 sugar ABC transporter substrate-binding protein [Amycolatopsis rhabdoformis]
MRNLRSLVTTVVSALAVSAGLVACGESSGGASGVTIGYSTYTLSNPFFAGMQKGLQTGTRKHGYKLVTTNSNGDAAQQVTDIQNMISRGVNYVLLSPADGKAITPAVAAADSAKVPVISIADSVVPPITATITIDDVKAGSDAVDRIAADLTARKGSATGTIVDIQGILGTPSAARRELGFRQQLAHYPGLRVAAAQDGGYDTAKSNSLMVDILQANPQIDAVFAANDAEAVGVSAAIKAQGRFKPVGDPGHIIVIGVDGSKPAIADVRAGVQDASISQNPIKMMEKAVDTVADLEAHKSVQKQIDWPSAIITLDSIDSPEVKNYGIWSDEV